MVVGALIGKQRLFLDAEAWRTIPWMQDTTPKTPQSELLDILIMIPGILHDHGSMDASSLTQSNPYQDLIGRVRKHLIKLYQWRWQWHTRFSHEVGLEFGDDSSLSPGPERLRRLHFGRFVAASEIMLYNATLMWLLALMFKMDPIGASEQIEACAVSSELANNVGVRYASFAPLRRLGGAVSLRDPALEICRTFEWVAAHHDCSKEPTYLYLFPVGMAMTALKDDPASMDWVKGLLSVSSVTANYTQSDNQAGFGFYLSREALLAPDRERAEADLQLFSKQDMRNFGV